MYQVHIERRAVKELRRITAIQQSIIVERISSILTFNPFPKGDNPKRLTGQRAFRLRIGDYRVLYTIAGSIIYIYAIRHRKDAYC